MIKMALILVFSFFQGSLSPIYDYKIVSIDGKEVTLSSFKGKNILIVNTASNCGFTKQYKDLQALQDQYKDDLIVIGFPANNFGEQEPGTNEEIASFCEKNFGVTFLLSEKTSVKGDDISPLFEYLTESNPELKGEIKWNFEKFFIDKDGNLIARFPSKVNPQDEQITKLIR